MPAGQTWGKQEGVLLKDFSVPDRKITFEAGTVLETVGFDGTRFQCLIKYREKWYLIWVPYNITEKK
ncbi:MAG: hypothetical protein PHR36_04115 [Patescibacteria group bacterium]|nr:hypothetical protein [Patescibacteria group bacterium]